MSSLEMINVCLCWGDEHSNIFRPRIQGPIIRCQMLGYVVGSSGVIALCGGHFAFCPWLCCLALSVLDILQCLDGKIQNTILPDAIFLCVFFSRERTAAILNTMTSHDFTPWSTPNPHTQIIIFGVSTQKRAYLGAVRISQKRFSGRNHSATSQPKVTQ